MITRQHSSVGNKSDCGSRDQEIASGPVPYFHGDHHIIILIRFLIYHEIISMAILLPLIQVGCCQLQAKVCAQSIGQQLSQAGKKCGKMN